MFIETLLVLSCWPAAPADEPREKPLTPEEQYKALAEEFSRAARGLWEAKTDEERDKVGADGSKLPPRFLALAEKDPAGPIAQTALVGAVTAEIWIENNTSHPGFGQNSPQDRALALLLRHHLASDQLGEVCRRA